MSSRRAEGPTRTRRPRLPGAGPVGPGGRGKGPGRGLATLALGVALLACGPSPDTERGSAARASASPPRPAESALPRVRVQVGMQIIDAELAETAESQARGLSGRRRLPEGHGMLFVYPRPGRYGFWMPDMHFDLDLVWIRDGRIVDLTPDVPHDPPGDELPVYRPSEPADQILEVPAGTAARHGWRPGDPVVVEARPAS